MFYHVKIVCTWNFVVKNSTRRKKKFSARWLLLVLILLSVKPELTFQDNYKTHRYC